MASKPKIKVQINPLQVGTNRDEELPSRLFDRNLQELQQNRTQTAAAEQRYRSVDGMNQILGGENSKRQVRNSTNSIDSPHYNSEVNSRADFEDQRARTAAGVMKRSTVTQKNQ